MVWMSLKTLNFLCTFDVRNCLYLRMLSHVAKCVSLGSSDNKHFECKCVTTWMVRSWKSTKVICGMFNMAAMFLFYEFSQTIQNNKLLLSCQCNHFDDVYFKMRIKWTMSDDYICKIGNAIEAYNAFDWRFIPTWQNKYCLAFLVVFFKTGSICNFDSLLQDHCFRFNFKACV